MWQKVTKNVSPYAYRDIKNSKISQNFENFPRFPGFGRHFWAQMNYQNASGHPKNTRKRPKVSISSESLKNGVYLISSHETFTTGSFFGPPPRSQDRLLDSYPMLKWIPPKGHFRQPEQNAAKTRIWLNISGKRGKVDFPSRSCRFEAKSPAGFY